MPSAKPKSDLYRDLLPLVNGCRIELLDHPKSVNQLCALERKTARSGKDSIDHPPGQHDDAINAIAGAAVHAHMAKKPLFIPPAHVDTAPSYFKSFGAIGIADMYDNASGPPGGWPTQENAIRRQKT
jgi:hypothetical protein